MGKRNKDVIISLIYYFVLLQDQNTSQETYEKRVFFHLGSYFMFTCALVTTERSCSDLQLSHVMQFIYVSGYWACFQSLYLSKCC